MKPSWMGARQRPLTRMRRRLPAERAYVSRIGGKEADQEDTGKLSTQM